MSEVTERLSEDYSDLKVKHQMLKDRTKHVYDLNNVLIDENEKLKARVKELENTAAPVIDIPEYVAALEFLLVSHGLKRAAERITQGSFVNSKTLEKERKMCQHWMDMYHAERDKVRSLEGQLKSVAI